MLKKNLKYHFREGKHPFKLSKENTENNDEEN